MAANPAEITQPVRVDPDTLIHNVYADVERQPDDISQAGFSQYLVDRMYGVEDEVARGYKPGDEVPRDGLVFDRWRGKKIALALSIAATLAVNAVVNGKNIVGKVRETADDLINMVDPQTRTIPSKPGKNRVVVERQYPGLNIRGHEQPSGVVQGGDTSARGMALALSREVLKGGKITRVQIEGMTSDEWIANGIKSIGRPDKDNRQLALERAQRFGQSLVHESKRVGVDLPQVEAHATEHVLRGEDLSQLLVSVQKSKYNSVLEAVAAYNRDDPSMSTRLKNIIQREIGIWRAGKADVTLEVEYPVQHPIDAVPSHKEKVKRKDTKHPIIPLIIPIPPLPWWRREHTDPFERPPHITEEPLDKVWIELYEEALKPNNELVENAWSLSRKYQALYREERITQGLRYDYLDDKDNQQSINVLFVDRPELNHDVIGAVTELLFDISMMQRGKVAEKLDTIVVLPAESTGAQRPDKIGLGIDEQMHQNILGVAIPSIGLVELQLPQKPTHKQLEAFNGFRWTLAHEVAGHFTDVNERSRLLDPAESNRPGRSFTTGNPWLDIGDDGYATTGRRRSVAVEQFAIPHPRGENREFIVNVGSSLLRRAASARLRGQAPTMYGDTKAAELYAETAAAVVTGIPIPAEQAGVHPSHLGDKPGYYVDAGLQHRFVSHVGARRNTEGLEWDDRRAEKRRETFRLTVLRGAVELNGDADQHSTSEYAKNNPYQDEQKRLKILARVRR